MRISIIAAMAKNRVIGNQNALPWRLPEDLRHFKDITMGHHILMGRKTFESIGKPLPGRSSIVISRNPETEFPGVTVVPSLEEAISYCREDEEIFFVGGGDIYSQAIKHARKMYLTEIQKDFEGDAHFPEFDPRQWKEVSRERRRTESGLEYHFVVYERTV